MAGFIGKLMNKVRNFSVFDFAMLKFTLLSAGILFGFYLAPFLTHLILYVWIIFAISYAYLFFICFKRKEK